MAYHKMKMNTLETRFGLLLTEQEPLFPDAPAVQISSILREVLAENTNFALEVSTEKARSEFIVAPVLTGVRRQMNRRVSLHSGVDFSVDAATGLVGECDFLFSLSPMQSVIRAPAVAIVEAKKGEIRVGMAQCLAEMVAAQRFNAAKGEVIPTIYGAITTGSNWKFLTLYEKVVTLDRAEYYLNQIEQIVGIFVYMLKTAEAIRNAALAAPS